MTVTARNARQPDSAPVVFLLGPTASGKTGIAIELVQAFAAVSDIQIISVDSSLVYRGMDIGTAKPTAQEQALAPHCLIDICDPWDTYSAARFCVDAKAEIKRAVSAGKLPLLVGGTMLYYNALEHGLATMPDADPRIRSALSARAEAEGWQALHRQLAEVDPHAAERIHPNDPQRIQRALEVWEISGKPISVWQREQRQNRLAMPLLKFGLYPADRKALHVRIEQRFDAMLNNGFLDEVERLRSDSRIHASLPSMRSVGYRQAWQYLDGQIGRAEWQDRAVAATRQLAKRQLTWMRGMRSLYLLDSFTDSVESVAQQLKNLIAG